jgi:hypothetical protein
VRLQLLTHLFLFFKFINKTFMNDSRSIHFSTLARSRHFPTSIAHNSRVCWPMVVGGFLPRILDHLPILVGARR